MKPYSYGPSNDYLIGTFYIRDYYKQPKENNKAYYDTLST